MPGSFLAILIHTPAESAWLSCSHSSPSAGETKWSCARPSSAPTGGRIIGSLRQVEHELERVIEGALLIQGEVADALAERAGVDGADHLAQHLRWLALQRDLRVEPGRERRA